jgi:drug/metabolite transporter (DMT)-like permease
MIGYCIGGNRRRRLSLNGVFTRMIAASVTTQIAGRSFFGALFLTSYLMVRENRVPSVRSLPKAGYWLIAALSVSQICTVFAFNFTTIANVNLIYAISPFISAWLAKWFGGEELPARTVIASLGCLGGVYCLAGPSAVQGSAVGILFAVLMSLSFASALVMNRVYPHLPMLPITIASALIVALVFAPFADYKALTVRSATWLADSGCRALLSAWWSFLNGAPHPSCPGSAHRSVRVYARSILRDYFLWRTYHQVTNLWSRIDIVVRHFSRPSGCESQL